MVNSRRVVGNTVPTRAAWLESTFCMATLPDGSTSAATLSMSFAVPSQQATRQLSDKYSLSKKKSSASNTFVCVVVSPSKIKLQKTSLGYQPVLAFISSNAAATVLPRLTSCTVCAALPCLDDCGMAIWEVTINVSSSLSTPTAITIAVFCTSTSPKSPDTNNWSVYRKLRQRLLQWKLLVNQVQVWLRLP